MSSSSSSFPVTHLFVSLLLVVTILVTPSLAVPTTITGARLSSSSFTTTRQASLPIESPIPPVGTDDDPSPEPSPDASGEPDDDDDDEVCVEHSYLINAQHPSHTLVHGDHPISASVLCATSHPSLPCMTRHHMVRVVPSTITATASVEQEMSMAQFCVRPDVKCVEKKNVKVNSVLSHLWTDETHDVDVKVKVMLTMFDARHPKTMQRMLHRAIALRRRVFNM